MKMSTCDACISANTPNLGKLRVSVSLFFKDLPIPAIKKVPYIFNIFSTNPDNKIGTSGAAQLCTYPANISK